MKKNGFLIFLFIFSVFISLFWAFFYIHAPVGGDAETYDTTAQAINRQGIIKGFQSINQYISRPLYPVFLALVYAIFGHYYFFPIFIQIMLTFGTVFLVYAISKNLFGEITGRLSGILMALFPSAWAYSYILMREAITVFAITLLVFFLYKIKPDTKIFSFAILGLLFAFLGLLNAVLELLIIFIALWYVCIFYKKIDKKTLLKNMAALALVFLAINGFWIAFIKNQILRPNVSGDTPALLLMEKYERMQNIQNNYSLYFTAHSLGDFFALKMDKNYDKSVLRLGNNSRKLYDDLLTTMSQKQVDSLFYKNALSGFLSHPLLFIGQTVLEILKFTSPMTPFSSMQPMLANTHNNISDIAKAMIIISMRFISWVFYIFILATIIRKRKNLETMGWLVLIIIYYYLVYISIYAIARYSLPIYPLYIILFSAGATDLFEKNKKTS